MRDYGVRGKVTCKELDANIFAFKDAVILLVIQLQKLITEDTAILDSWGCKVIVSGVHGVALKAPSGYIAWAVRVLGKTNPKGSGLSADVPHVRLVALHTCKERGDCLAVFGQGW